jgi:hypothetical protein
VRLVRKRRVVLDGVECERFTFARPRPGDYVTLIELQPNRTKMGMSHPRLHNLLGYKCTCYSLEHPWSSLTVAEINQEACKTERDYECTFNLRLSWVGDFRVVRRAFVVGRLPNTGSEDWPDDVMLLAENRLYPAYYNPWYHVWV